MNINESDAVPILETPNKQRRLQHRLGVRIRERKGGKERAERTKSREAGGPRGSHEDDSEK